MNNLNGNGVNVIWRYVALIMVSANITAFSGYIAFGMDSVKHSEIDSIMLTRAPYVHDKQRIDEKFSSLELRITHLEEKR